jgi:hypothetical protein
VCGVERLRHARNRERTLPRVFPSIGGLCDRLSNARLKRRFEHSAVSWLGRR